VYEPPRELLRAMPGVTLVEMPRSFEETWCCGANAAEINPEFSEYVSGERRREAASTGAEKLVSCCPFCRDALDKKDGREISYADLTELIADRLSGEVEI
ncbi:MAG: (Fe-S)-binding protein, partial [Oscillospiraceae bacterium]|nr:(Fe-S)-binding protein [Oscillospiraceae bacterium]